MGYVFKTLSSPVGNLTLIASDNGLAGILWADDSPGRVALTPRERNDTHPILCQAEQQLNEYFARRRTEFDVPLIFHGTPFQKRVWNALLTIPFGETRTYGEIARQLGQPTASRAVGGANNRNPISIIAPCHRVIGGSGQLTGFAGGLDTKQFLLNLESRQPMLDL